MNRIRRLNKDFRAAIFFILPSLVGFLIFIIIPIFSSALLSFTSYSGSFERMSFIGFQNYKHVLSDAKFWKSLGVTFIFVISAVTLQLVLGFAFALILNTKLRGRVLFRSILFLPVVLSSIAVCLAFIFIFHPSKGPINKFLESISLPMIPWLADRSTALMTILIVYVWQSFGYYMIIFLSGLQAINPALYEVADIDGASEIQKIFNITLPGISPVIFFCIIIAVINAFKTFDHIFIMTGGQYGGGPADSTRVLAFDIYQNGFLFWQIGYGTAESVILFLFVMIVTIMQYILQKRWVNYYVV